MSKPNREPLRGDELLVSVADARRLLRIGNNKFWTLAAAGEFELIGSERKRWVLIDSIRAYVERQRSAAQTSKRSGHHNHASAD